MEIYVTTVVNAFNDDYTEHFVKVHSSKEKAQEHINGIETDWQNNAKERYDFKDDELQDWLKENLEDEITPTQDNCIYFKHYIYDGGDEKIFAIHKECID